MLISNRLAPVLSLCLLAAASPVFAQATGGGRPFRGLFGSPRGAATSEMLDLTVSVVEAYDDDVLADSGSVFGPLQEPLGGYFTMLTSTASYQKLGTRAQISGNVASNFAYFPALGGVRNLSHTAGAGLAGQLGRTRVMFNQTFAYSPAYLYGLFPSVEPFGPGATMPAGADYESEASQSYSYGTFLSVSRPFTRRGTVSAGAYYSTTDFQGAAAARRPDVTAHTVQAAFSRSLTRNTAVRVGYTYRGGDVGRDGIRARSVAHGLEFGTDYSRPLSATRRAVFSFTLGSSAVSAVDQAVIVPGQAQRYRAHGALTFGYQFNPRWQARGAYRRDMQYVPEFSEPIFTDGVTIAVDGLLTPRMDVLTTAGYSNASSALSQDAARLDTYTADVRVRYALTRMLALYAGYLYYFYEFQARTPVSATVPPGLERSGVRVGLTMWVPLLRR